MPSDPQLLSEILAGPPEEADYDALYADLMATPRGRWFLTEYAGRNRFADTHLLAGAIARVEAAVRGEPVPQVPASVAREIAELAVAIGRIEDEFVAPLRFASERFSAAERIQDVAFALREREVDAEMSDVLEAAIRELGEIFARGDAAAEGAQNALALLRELKGRVHAMVADAVVGAGVSPAAVTPGETPAEAIAEDGFGEEGDIPDALLAERSVADAQADDHFAAMIGALAASFPAPDEPPAPDETGEPAPEPPGEFADVVSPAVEAEGAFEPAAESHPEVGQGGEDIGSADTPAPTPAESSPSVMPTPEEALDTAPLGDETAAAAEPVIEPPEVEREKVPAFPEPVEQALAVIQQLDTDEFAKEEPPPDAAASEPAGDAGLLPEETVGEPAAAEDVAAETSADHGSAPADAPDGRDGTAAPPVIAGTPEDGGAPGERETPPLSPESPTVDGEEALDGRADEASPSQSPSPDRSDESGCETVPTAHLSDEPSIGAADVPTMDVPTTNLPAADLSAPDLPPAADVSAGDLPAMELSAADLAEPVSAEVASGLEEARIPAQPEPDENAALVPHDETEVVPDDAQHTTIIPDYILGSATASGGDVVERLDHTVEESISAQIDTSEPVQTPAAAEPIATVLKETETTKQVLPDLEAAPGPDEDPADLFEPLPMPSPIPTPQAVPAALHATGAAPASGGAMSLLDMPIAYHGGAGVPGRAGAVELQDDARSPAAAAQMDHAVPAASPAAEPAAAPSPQMRLPLESFTPQPRPAAPTPRGIPRPAPSDPLASLSEEELIALFS